jgi:hypothetical protein
VDRAGPRTPAARPAKRLHRVPYFIHSIVTWMDYAFSQLQTFSKTFAAGARQRLTWAAGGAGEAVGGVSLQDAVPAIKSAAARFHTSLGESPKTVTNNLCSVCEYGAENVRLEWWTIVYFILFVLVANAILKLLFKAFLGALAHARRASKGVEAGVVTAVAALTHYGILASVVVAAAVFVAGGGSAQ